MRIESDSRGPACRPRSGGFTLLEMVIVLLIVSLLIGAIFNIVGGVTQLASSMNAEQEKDARLHALVHLFRRTLLELPPNALVRLRTKQTGTRYLSQLALRGAPSPVNGDTTGVTVFQTEDTPDGYQRLVLRSLNPAQALAWEKGDTTAGLRVPLMDNVAKLEWRFFNTISGEWEPLWNERLDLVELNYPAALSPPPGTQIIGAAGPQDATGAPIATAATVGRRPGLIELVLALGAEKPQRWVFWTAPSQMALPQAPSVNAPPPGLDGTPAPVLAPTPPGQPPLPK